MTNSYSPQTWAVREPPRRRWDAPRRMSVGDIALIICLLIIGFVAFIGAMPVLLEAAGVSGALISALVALIPVLFTVLLVLFIDRWEPEPKWLYLVAFVWGAGVAVAGALFLNDIVYYVVGPVVLGSDASEMELMRLSTSFGAPLTEEFTKGLGVIVMFFAFRKYFNGPADGIVYGALIGAGFAFTENIIYFTRNFADLGEIFQIRFLDGPLSHDAYTALFGFFIGFAEYSKHRIAVLGWFVPAMASSSFFHWLNNNALYWDGMTYGTYNLINNLSVLLILLVVVTYALRYEHKAVEEGLAPYVRAGYVSHDEQNMVMDLRQRRQAINWAGPAAAARGSSPDDGRQAMETMIEELLQLGHDRTRAVRREIVGRSDVRAQESERLAIINYSRSVFQ